MMKRRQPFTLAAYAFALAATPSAWAQNAATTSSSAQPRSQNERIVTEGGTPSTINRQIQKDEAAAEGARGTAIAPNIPRGAVGSSSVPAPAPLPGTGIAPGTAPAPGGVGLDDPRARGVMAGRPMMTAGLDVAMLIEHALGMAIEGSSMQAIAAPGATADGPSKELFEHGRRELQEGRDLLVNAATDGRSVPAASPTRRLYDAANAYITALSAMSAATPASPAEQARVAMVNHAVKEVLDANHIASMGRMYGGSAATEQLVAHARKMKDGGTQAILRMAGNGSPAQPGAAMLAQHGRDLIEAADQLAATIPAATGMRGPLPSDTPGLINGAPDVPTNRRTSAIPGGLPNNGEDPKTPGRFQDPRPEIIGGTYSTGSPSVGTVNNAGVKEALRESVTSPNPDPNPAIPNTPNTLGPNGTVVPSGTVPGSSAGGVQNPK